MTSDNISMGGPVTLPQQGQLTFIHGDLHTYVNNSWVKIITKDVDDKDITIASLLAIIKYLCNLNSCDLDNAISHPDYKEFFNVAKKYVKLKRDGIEDEATIVFDEFFSLPESIRKKL
jgi:hypothetical protein